jgi:hypothetical protein
MEINLLGHKIEFALCKQHSSNMFLSLEVTFTSNRMLVAASNMYVVLFSGLPDRGHSLEVRPLVVEEKCTSSC